MLVYSVQRVLRSCEQYVFESFWHTDRENTDSPSPVAKMFNSRGRCLSRVFATLFPRPVIVFNLPDSSSNELEHFICFDKPVLFSSMFIF